LSPRNFNGRGLLTAPGWLDLLLPLVMIFLLYPRRDDLRFSWKVFRGVGIAALVILLVPATTTLLFSHYIGSSSLLLEAGGRIFLRWLLVPPPSGPVTYSSTT
jgi:predicted branched-subunit amino acid permease